MQSTTLTLDLENVSKYFILAIFMRFSLKQILAVFFEFDK